MTNTAGRGYMKLSNHAAPCKIKGRGRLDAWAESTLSQSRQIFPAAGKATRRSQDNAIALPLRESDTHLLHRHKSRASAFCCGWNNVAASRSCAAAFVVIWPRLKGPEPEMCSQRRFLIAPAQTQLLCRALIYSGCTKSINAIGSDLWLAMRVNWNFASSADRGQKIELALAPLNQIASIVDFTR